jgi:hypothetical protein
MTADVPYQRAVHSAAQRCDSLVWQVVQASGAPIAAARAPRIHPQGQPDFEDFSNHKASQQRQRNLTSQQQKYRQAWAGTRQ